MRMQVAFRHDWRGFNLRLLVARVSGVPVHCCTLYGDECFDVALGGVRQITRAQRFARGEWEIVEMPAWVDPLPGRALAVSRRGWPYDWKSSIFGWLLGRRAGSGDRRRVNCSEEAADELRLNEIPLLYTRSAHYTPRKLRDELVTYHGFPSHRVSTT